MPIATCTTCLAGSFAGDSAASCTPCLAGTFSSDGQAACTACTPGHYTSAPGGSSCSECPAGSFASTAGATSCTACPAGTAAPAGSSTCTGCAAGTYALGGSTTCTACEDCDDGNGCTADSCLPQSGVCQHIATCALPDAGAPEAGGGRDPMTPTPRGGGGGCAVGGSHGGNVDLALMLLALGVVLGLRGRRAERGSLDGGRPGFIVWLTGMPCAGKTTLARGVEEKIAAFAPTEVLDGDEMRKLLSPELGFSRADRALNVERIAQVARLLARQGVAVLVACVSPHADMRGRARQIAREAGLDFFEVHVHAPLPVLLGRDTKELYARAAAGQLTGVSGQPDPYEEPVAADVIIDTSAEPVAASVERLVAFLRERTLVMNSEKVG
jgi:adenylylsulfate kinase